MPIYEYRRPDGSTFELMQSFSDEALTHDPETGVEVQRVLHAPAVHFKGKGFYNTDYGTRKRQRENAANGDGGSANGSSGEKASSAGESGGSGAGDSGSASSSGDSASSSEGATKTSDAKSGGGTKDSPGSKPASEPAVAAKG